MKRNTMNFWIDLILFIQFILVVFTGILLREFPVDLSGYTILGVPRKEFADLHWMLSLLMILTIFAHLMFHWGWVKAVSVRKLRIGPKVLAVSVIVLLLMSMVVAPVYLTKDLPDKQNPQAEIFKPGLSSESAGQDT
ncbi:MAG: DUF4405 domain-containing protein [Deltaproteobacteria bacterium]|nr:DUF4405 domain-containing protein [Deltaproteobacteria bacterium]